MGGPCENIINLDIVVPNQTRYLSLIGNIAEQIAKQLDTGDGDRDTLVS
jgi:serine/threonine-protein kinase RsbW